MLENALGPSSAEVNPIPQDADAEPGEASPSRAPADDAVAAEAPPTSPQMAPETFEILESAPERGAAPEAPNRDSGMESGPEASADASPLVQAPPTSPPAARERLDSNETAPGKGVAAEPLTQLERELASGMYAPPSIGPDGRRRFYYRATPNGVMAV